jgi:hypothetical protein
LKLSRAFCLLWVLILPACRSFGPDTLKSVHPLYNNAVNGSLNDQFIQNLVRLHYHDPILFLDVSTIAASARLDVAGGLNQSQLGLPSAAYDLLKFSVGADYYEMPTVTFAPLQGEAFVKSLLNPISLTSIFELTASGWSAKRVFGLCIERINGLDNAPGASGPMPDAPPSQNTQFIRLIDLLDKIRHAHLMAVKPDESGKELYLELNEEGPHGSDVAEIKRLLELDPSKNRFRLATNLIMHDPSVISITTRSIGSIMFYLSHNVDTPVEHTEKGWVRLSHDAQGHAYDWSQTPAGQLFHIRVSSSHPDESFLAIPYNDHWFYIPQNDLQSKSTFMLLTQLFRLQAGSAKSQTPALTIPVR